MDMLALCNNLAQGSERDCLRVALDIKAWYPEAVVFCIHSKSDCLENCVHVNGRSYTHHFAVYLDGKIWDPLHWVFGEATTEYSKKVQCEDPDITRFDEVNVKCFGRCPQGCEGCLRAEIKDE